MPWSTRTDNLRMAGIIDFAIAWANLFPAHNWKINMPEPEKILRMRTVLERTGLSRSTLYRKMRSGTFPNQVQLSEHCCGWRESAINRWMADPMSYKEDQAFHAPTDRDGRSGERLLS
jgi:prophage regulatory protein